ncbi:aspartate/glutamate racemase family protein [Photobacterium nomapromontoriensis]|uniref:aspartate/glutamate racemase family protein n=1 Tax=Photobacterium nomapromontoriensis TaxID=2910237 RepID=UPI003D0FF09B
MKLLVIAPVNTDHFNAEILSHIREAVSADTHVDIVNLSGGSSCIQSRVDLATNAPYVIQTVAAHANDYDGIFVTDMDMCGVEASRQVADIPVIGGFRASAYTAMLLSQKYAILTIRDVVDLQNEHVRAFGIQDNLACIESLPLGVYDLSNKQLVMDMLVKYSIDAVKNHDAEAIMFGCTGFVGYADALSQRLQADLGMYIPVMDPNQCAIKYLELLVANKLRQSDKSYPRVKALS